METYTEGTGEKTIIEDIKNTVKQRDDARNAYNRQALMNVLFLYGRHHFTISRNYEDASSVGQRLIWELEANKRHKKLKRTSNYILPLFRSVYSRLIRQKANLYAEPTTSAQKDKDAARVAKEVIEDFWINCNQANPWIGRNLRGMQSILMKLILYKLTLGMGYLIPYFNPKASVKLFDQESENIFEAEAGETEVRVAMPLNIFHDRFGRDVIERRYISIDQIEYEYGQEVEGMEIKEDTIEARIMRLLDGESKENMAKEKDGAYVYTRFQVPTKKEKKGKVWACTENEILYDGPLPKHCKKQIPVFEFKYQDLGFSSHAQGAIEQVIDLQQDYNFTITRIGHHKKLMTGKLMIPGTSKLKVTWDDNVGQVIRYAMGSKPSYEAPVSVPAYYYKELTRIREDMENLFNSHDSSMGRSPKQVKSGVGIQSLQELDDSQIAPELIMFEQKLGYFAEQVLDICQENYSERRLLNISGDNLAYEIKSFIGSQLFGNKRIQVRVGSNFPLNKSDRTNYILMLRDKGLISPEKAKDLLEFNDIEGAFSNLDETAAKQDILNIIEGQIEVIAEPFEDHTIFLKVINDFRKGSIYQKLPPEIRERINNWTSQHQQMLLAEQQAAKTMGGPLPPPAKPQIAGVNQ